MNTTTGTWESATAAARQRNRRDWIIEKTIYVAALVAISLIVLIFIFVGREALPVLTSAEVHEEVTLETLFRAQERPSSLRSPPRAGCARPSSRWWNCWPAFLRSCWASSP